MQANHDPYPCYVSCHNELTGAHLLYWYLLTGTQVQMLTTKELQGSLFTHIRSTVSSMQQGPTTSKENQSPSTWNVFL